MGSDADPSIRSGDLGFVPRFPYSGVVASTTPASNWSKFAVHPFADALLWLIANYTQIHPNVLTITASILGFAAAGSYLQGDSTGMIAGAVLFYCSFALDAIDGALARLTGKRSVFGAWLDTIVDFLRSMTVAPAFAIGVYRQTGDIRALYLGFGVLAVGLWYFYQAEVSNKLLGQRPAQIATASATRRWPWVQRLGLVPSPFGLPDYEAVYLVIGPLVNRPLAGMLIALIGGILSRIVAAVVVVTHLRKMQKTP